MTDRLTRLTVCRNNSDARFKIVAHIRTRMTSTRLRIGGRGKLAPDRVAQKMRRRGSRCLICRRKAQGLAAMRAVFIFGAMEPGGSDDPSAANQAGDTAPQSSIME
jgi:hypothetical protein